MYDCPIGDQCSRQVSSLPGIQQWHIQYHYGCLLLLGDDSPLLYDFIIVPSEPVDTLNNKSVTGF